MDTLDLSGACSLAKGSEEPLLLALDVRLVKAPDPVADSTEIEVLRVEFVTTIAGGFDDTGGETIVELLLFGGVVSAGK